MPRATSRWSGSTKEQDGSGGGVFGRRVGAGGAPTGPEFQVTTYTMAEHFSPRIGTDGEGDFVVVWVSPHGDDSLGIFAQRFTAIAPFDVDGNGTTDPLTDALLVLRYTFGFRGSTLTTGAVGPGCTRCTAPQIESYLQPLT